MSTTLCAGLVPLSGMKEGGVLVGWKCVAYLKVENGRLEIYIVSGLKEESAMSPKEVGHISNMNI